jgi:hypothetical protein
MGRLCSRFLITTWLLTGCVVVATADTGPERSTEAADALVTLMKSRSLDAVAAVDPQNPGRVVAAMLLPDVQLLVVAAESTALPYLKAQIAQQQYRDVYAMLNSAAVPETKLFFQDMGCDGLTNEDGGVDIMYEQGKTQTIFDGDWKRHKVTKAEYGAKLEKADAEYARMLRLLTDSLHMEAKGFSR